MSTEQYVQTLCWCLHPFWRCGLELQELEDVKRLSTSLGAVAGQHDQTWEVVMEKKDFRVWKRPIPNSHLYEYRGQPMHNLTMCHLLSEMQIMHTFRFLSCALGFSFGWDDMGMTCLKSKHPLFMIAVLGSYNDVTPRQFFNVQVQTFQVLVCAFRDTSVSVRWKPLT